jgi:diadenosine tetraphosphatase ApaH/serine/threonine PP2A family protein phosphatase
VAPNILDIPETAAVALISDTHANITALEAVLADIAKKGICHTIMLGDVIGKGPAPGFVTDRLRQLGVPMLFGNWEELIITHTSPALDWQCEKLGTERLDYLANLPYALDLPRWGGLVRLFHAAHTSVWDRVRLFDPPEAMAALFDASPALGLDAPEPLAVAYGDIHTAFSLHLRALPTHYQHRQGKLVINCGSVGNPLDIPVPSYAVLGSNYMQVELLRVPYDIEAECRRASQAQMPELDAYLIETRSASYQKRAMADWKTKQ